MWLCPRMHRFACARPNFALLCPTLPCAAVFRPPSPYVVSSWIHLEILYIYIISYIALFLIGCWRKGQPVLAQSFILQVHPTASISASMKSSSFLMCFFLDPPAAAVVPVPGPGFPLPPGARGFSLPHLASSNATPNAAWKNSEGFGHSGDFPLLWDSSIPPGIPVSIGIDILWIVKVWNCPSGVCVYECDGDGWGDRMERSPSTSLASS